MDVSIYSDVGFCDLLSFFLIVVSFIIICHSLILWIFT